MNELEQQEFDYSLVDNKTAIKLEKFKKQLNRIYNSYSVDVGEVLYHAQKELSNYGDGTFINWAESIGFKESSLYNYINAYKFLQRLEKPEEKETFLAQPKTLQYAMSKPSAKEEVNQAVLDGEVKSSKEYKELEKQLKQRDEEKEQLENQLKNSTRSEEILQDKLEQLENKPPKVVERFLEPEDYQQIKTSLEQKESYISELQTEVANMRNERNEMDKKSREYDRLNEAINEMNGRLNEGQMRIKNQKAVYDLIRKSEELVKEVAPLVYALDHLDVEDNEYAKKPIIQLIKNIDDISQKLKKQLSERQIIEVN